MDVVDQAQEQNQAPDEAALALIRQKAADMDAGHPGICDKCGEFSERLVERRHFRRHGRNDIADDIDTGICPPCRDVHKLP